MNEALNIARKLKNALDILPAHVVIMEPAHESEPAHVDIGPYMTADGQTVIVADCYSDGKIGIAKAHPTAIYGDDYLVIAESVADACRLILTVLLKPSDAPTKAEGEIEPNEEQRAAAQGWMDSVEQRASGRPTLALFLAQREAGHLDNIKKLEARLARAVDIIVSEELDRDFGEEPTPRILAVRELLTECGYQPPRCSFGAIIGYSGTHTCPR